MNSHKEHHITAKSNANSHKLNNCVYERISNVISQILQVIQTQQSYFHRNSLAQCWLEKNPKYSRKN